MTVDDLVRLLIRGMQETFDLVRRLNDDPDRNVEPEYLKTVRVAEVLLNGTSDARVRLEQATLQVLGRSALPPRSPDFSSSISRHGKADIVVYSEEKGFLRPVIVVENKRYVAGFSGIENDVIRCLEFLAVKSTKSERSLEVTAVTFFWREVRGLTKEQQENAANLSLGKIDSKVKIHAAQYNAQCRFKYVPVRCSPFASVAEAEAIDAEGVPAYYIDEPITIYAVVFVFFRDGPFKFLEMIRLKDFE